MLLLLKYYYSDLLIYFLINDIFSISGSQVDHLAGEAFASKQGDLHDWRRSRKPASLEIVRKTRPVGLKRKMLCLYIHPHVVARFPASIQLSGPRRTRTARTWAWPALSACCRTSRCPLSQSPAWTGAPTSRACACARASIRPSACSSSPNSTRCENADWEKCAICSDGGVWMRSPGGERESLHFSNPNVFWSRSSSSCCLSLSFEC